MHRLSFPFLFLIAACSATTAPPKTGASKTSAAPRYSAARFFAVVSYGGASFSHDESALLLHADSTGIFNVYRQNLAGGPAEPLTESTDDAMFSVSYFPQDDRLLYSADQGGNELRHLFVRQPDGTSHDLTPGEAVRARFMGWHESDTHFFVATNERDARYFDLYSYKTSDYARTLVYTNSGGYELEEVSPNGRWIALRKVRNNLDSDLYTWDASLPDVAPIHLTPHEGDAQHRAFTFTADSSALVFATDARGEFYQAWQISVPAGKAEPLVVADWDVQYVQFSRHGTYRIVGINVDARTEVLLTRNDTGEVVPLPELPPGIIRRVTVSRSETKVAFYLDSDTSPANLFVVDLETSQGRRLTDATSAAIDPQHLVTAENVRYRSFDDLEIPALLYRPHGVSPKEPAPGVVWVHGGPGGQSRHRYVANLQHLVNHGYAVLAVNNRGSSGYGKTFFHLDDRRHGDVDLKDCIWARRYLETLPWVDEKRIAILGGSYGGFMVAAALAFSPETFDAGVNIFGVTNWLRTLESIPPWWASRREALYAELGDPATERDRLRRISPLFSASSVRRPLLVVQGANDPRVLKVESDELVEAVRANGVQVEYLVFPDEGHGFRKRTNRIAASEAYLRFLDQHLRR